MEIREAGEKEDFLKCWEVVKELRPHLDQEKYLTLMLYMLDEGYKMIFIEEKEQAVAFCGYRFVTMLYRGRSLYIDDLCTLPGARGKGFAKALLLHTIKLAREAGLQNVHLDSGHQRFDAHRLYLGMGFTISAHHFEMAL